MRSIFSNPVFDFGDIIRIGQNTTTPVFGQEFEKLKERGSEIKHFHVVPSLQLAEKLVNGKIDGVR